MTDVLARIVARKRAEVAVAKARASSREIPPRARATDGSGDGRSFVDAVRGAIEADGTALIAEIKRRSPSHGVIRADFDAGAIARAYAAGGAACISVLTDGPDFGGSLDDLTAARAASPLPVLRKDFIVDAWQIGEARFAGADCVLIIMAAVGADSAADLVEAAHHDFGLDTLLEVASEAELDAAHGMEAVLIGINNRDLRTLAVDPDRALRLAGRVASDRIAVALSGLATPANLARHRAAGIGAFLVGEALMRAPDIEAATRALLGR